MVDRLRSKRRYDTRQSNMNLRSMIGWFILTVMAATLLFSNAYLLIVFPTVGTRHSIFGVVMGFIMVVGCGANFVGYFYDDSR